MMSAPTSKAPRATLGFMVSMDMSRFLFVFLIRLMTGRTRLSSSSASMGDDPGRLDSPPTSMIGTFVCLSRSILSRRDGEKDSWDETYSPPS